MPRAYTNYSHEKEVFKTKVLAHNILLALKKENRDVVVSGSGKALKYRVIKVKGGYGIFYTKTGKWRGDKGLRLGFPHLPKTLRKRKKQKRQKK